MADIRDRESLEAWLEDQPREVAVIIAARAALRVLPLVIPGGEDDRRYKSVAFLLPSCRATGAAWVAGAWPNRSAEVRSAATAVAAATGVAAARFAARSTDAAAAAAADAAAASTAATATARFAARSTAAAAAAAAAATATAGRFVARSTVAAAAAAFFSQFNHDAEFIESGRDVLALALAPLWGGDIPNPIRWRWEAFRDAQQKAAYGHWNVWIDWYEDRLKGAAGSRPVIEELEVARVLISDEEWEKGPAHVNAIIQSLEDAHRQNGPSHPQDADVRDLPEVPPQRPAVIEVQESEDGRLGRKAPSPPHLDDAARERRLREAWTAHDQALSTLEALNPGRNEPALAHAVAAYRGAMGASFEELNVIALGAHGERLVGYAGRVDDLLVGAGAAELAALVALHGLFVRQFEEWRQYISDGRDDPTADVVAAAAEVARETRNFPELFSEELVEVAVDLAEAATPPIAADPAHRLPRAVAFGVVDSDINILSGLSAQVSRYLGDAGNRARKGSLDGVENASRRATEAGLFFGLGAVGTLITGLPGELSFLTGIVALLKSGNAAPSEHGIRAGDPVGGTLGGPSESDDAGPLKN